MTNNKETSKSNKEDSKSTGNIKGTGQDKTKENYKYFLKGWCRHGFSGQVEKDEVKECLFTHPPICRKYMDQGVMVCKKGSKCFLKNVTVCKESRKKKTCLSSQEVKRYIIGYHIKWTKLVDKSTDSTEEAKEGNSNETKSTKKNMKQTKKKSPPPENVDKPEDDDEEDEGEDDDD